MAAATSGGWLTAASTVTQPVHERDDHNERSRSISRRSETSSGSILSWSAAKERKDFPKLVSYNRFVEWMPSVLVPLCAYLRYCFGKCRGVSFIDATSIKVCHNRRITAHKVFKSLAARGKTSVDWFFGFKLHLVITEQGELLNVLITPGNTDDRTPVPQLLQRLFGKVFGDRGYVSQKLALQMWQDSGIQLITKPRRNMKNRLMALGDKLLLRRRAITESVIDQLKNISQRIAFALPFACKLLREFELRIDRLSSPAQEAFLAD